LIAFVEMILRTHPDVNHAEDFILEPLTDSWIVQDLILKFHN
jgi:hypothetical protein